MLYCNIPKTNWGATLNWNFDFPQACSFRTSKSIFLNSLYPYIFMYYVWIYNGIKGLWLWIFQAVEIIKNTVSTLLLSHPPRIRPLEWCMVIWTSAKNSDFFSPSQWGQMLFKVAFKYHEIIFSIGDRVKDTNALHNKYFLWCINLGCTKFGWFLPKNAEV